jgi:hypothetical protein
MNDYLRTNLRFLAGSVSAIAAMALFFMMLSWAVGGTPFYKDVLLGDTFLPVLVGLMIAGVAANQLLRKKEETQMSGVPALNAR